MKTTQKHINIIDELKSQAIKDLSLLAPALEPSEKERFKIAIQNLEKTKKRMMIDLLQTEKQNVTEELERLNG